MKTVTLKLTANGTLKLAGREVGKVFPHGGKLHTNLYLPARTLSANALTAAALYADLAKRGVKIVEEQI